MVKENKLINFDLYFCGFWILEEEHSGLCDDDKFQKRQKIQRYKDIIPYPSKFSSYFLPLLKYLLMCHSPKAVAHK